MTNAKQRALGEKRLNCLRSIEVAANGLSDAAKDARSWRGKAAMIKRIGERHQRINELLVKLAEIDAQIAEA